jgi:hypothetical protein
LSPDDPADGANFESSQEIYTMTTQKKFVNGSPVPVTPKSNDEKVQDLTPGQAISSEDQDYDENEHSDDIAPTKREESKERN